ncbi:unnamed protein product, partial [Choristocarpus tenellus]
PYLLSNNRLGREQFQILEHKGLDSLCWKSAVQGIGADCKTMAHSKKQRLAVQLTNCHLEDSGRETTTCAPGDNDSNCVRGMKDDDVAFTAYTSYFHHVKSI